MQIYCLLLLFYYSKRYHTNENISGSNLLRVTSIDNEVKCIIGMKIFPMQIYCLFLFVYDSKRYHRNENISGANLWHVTFSLL